MSEGAAIARVGDVQEICQRIAQHSRGVDRADEGMLGACYHNDGTVDYRFFNGSAQVFAGILTGAQKGQPVTHHRTCQMWVEVDGNHARSESYIMAYAQSPDEHGAEFQRIICGRYLDRHERRSGEWRLTHRAYVLDTNANWPGVFDLPALTALDMHVPSGGHGAQDAGLALLGAAAARNAASENGEFQMDQDMPAPDKVASIIARQEIANLTMAYCRGVDRADEALLKSVFHDDSTVVSGVFNGNGQTFATEICRIVQSVFDQTFHSIANQWIEVTGDRAVGETYVVAVSTMTDADEGKSEMLSGGRYIDRFERRDGIWKIAERTYVSDWSRMDKTTRQMTDGMYAALDLHGSRGSGDPVYDFWN